MGGDIHKQGGNVDPESAGGADHLETHAGETHWAAAAKKTLVDGPVRTWQGAPHTEEAVLLAKKAKDLQVAVESGSIKNIDDELSDLKEKIHDFENKMQGMRQSY